MCALTPMVLKVAGLPLPPYYAQILRMSEEVQSLTEVIVAGENHNGLIYIDCEGVMQDVYNSTDEADLVRKYFYMEYNRLQKKDRLDYLFDP